jgi:predicted nucleic acid-binding protein
VTTYLLDTTVLIEHLRHPGALTGFLSLLLDDGHDLATSCVNIAELERGIRPKDRKAADALLDRLGYLDTTIEAAARAGRYLADYARRGRTLQLGDALIAGTARAHGAVLVTDNVRDFTMRDIRVQPPA